MTVRLRPHHLLCLLTYAGKGYSAAFTANYDAIVGRIGGGEDIVIVAGPDDICAPLLDGAEPHCHKESVRERDRLAARDVGALLTRPIEIGQPFALESALLRQMREAFAVGRTRNACTGCEWHDLCTSIAASGYEGAALSRSEAYIHPPQPHRD
jgi:hypothetical protein